MNVKAWIPLVIAVVLGLIAAMFANRLTQPQQIGVVDPTGTVNIVTANRNIAPGHEIRPDDLTMRSIAAEEAPEGTYLQVEQVHGRVAATQMVKGQPILAGLLAPEGMEAGLQALVPEGMRAITIEVNEFSGLAGMVRPGAMVDVMSTLQGSGEDAMARTIVQNVRVTAVGRRVSTLSEQDEEQEPARSITLLVTPEQAEKVELAAVTSRPRLVLRSPTDIDLSESHGVTLADLRGTLRNDLQDPFAVRPVDLATPTTKPVEQSEADPFGTRTREVTVIRGGVESRVILEYRRPDHIMTDVSIEPIELNK